MAWGRLAGVLVVALLAACNRRPQPVYEYGETVTLTTTEKDRAPAPPQAGAPRAPAADAAAAPHAGAAIDGAVAEDAVEPEAPLADGEWTTTVHTDAPPPRDESPVAAPEPEPAPAAGGAATAAPDARATPQQWYKAKSW
jgi:hypothetical protein